MEITSIGVSPEAKNRGLGSALIEDLKKRVDFSQCAYITLETDAVNNEAANAFYQKNGFTLARSYETHEGRKMNEYRWKE
jgi:ribosomal protein S18 acetylase RimI-like enzyme